MQVQWDSISVPAHGLQRASQLEEEEEEEERLNRAESRQLRRTRTTLPMCSGGWLWMTSSFQTIDRYTIKLMPIWILSWRYLIYCLFLENKQQALIHCHVLTRRSGASLPYVDCTAAPDPGAANRLACWPRLRRVARTKHCFRLKRSEGGSSRRASIYGSFVQAIHLGTLV